MLAILEEDKGEATMTPAGLSLRLQPYVVDWTTEQLEQIATYLLDWNANSRTSFVSQALLQALVAAKGAAALMKVRPMRAQLEAFLAYSERHFNASTSCRRHLMYWSI